MAHDVNSLNVDILIKKKVFGDDYQATICDNYPSVENISGRHSGKFRLACLFIDYNS